MYIFEEVNPRRLLTKSDLEMIHESIAHIKLGLCTESDMRINNRVNKIKVKKHGNSVRVTFDNILSDNWKECSNRFF